MVKQLIFNCLDKDIISYKQKYCSLRLLYKNDANDIIFNQNVGDFRINLEKKLAIFLNKDNFKNIDYIVLVLSSGIFYVVGLSSYLQIPLLPALKKDTSKRKGF